MAVEEKSGTPIVNDDDVYGKPINAVPAPEKGIGIDTEEILAHDIVDAGTASALDMSAFESFLNVSRNRNEIYNMLDSMGEDSQISAVLEAYASYATEYNDAGKVVWAESTDPAIQKYVTYLLDTMNVDKHIYGWVYSLCKYGDLYLRLYRESDYDDPIFNGGKERGKSSLTESAERLDEDVKVIAHSKNDKYSHYVERVANPAEMFELTKHGKTYGYIKANTGLSQVREGNLSVDWYKYSFKQRDVEVYSPTDYVHACLENDVSRQEEEVTISIDKEDGSEGQYTYKVKRGQSLLYNAFKIWRELMLLENSMLLNRVTKSSILRAIGVEVGDMPKEQVPAHLANIKSLIEQKSAINAGSSMSEYSNPGPIENCIYTATRNGQGALTVTQIGGDVDVKSIVDVEYFRDKLAGAFRVPKQILGWTGDSAGFDGGTSIAQLSIGFAKCIKRIQNTVCQAITDLINLMCMDKNLDAYVNGFTIKMLSPMTQAEVDRQDSKNTQIGVARDVMQLISENGVEDNSTRLKILQSLLSPVVTDPEITNLIQAEIDAIEKEIEETGVEPESAPMEDDGFGSVGIGRELRDNEPEGAEEPERPVEEPAKSGEEEIRLPSPEELNAGDFSNSDNPDFM